MTLASNALCTVAQVKAYLNDDSLGTDFDNLLEDLVNRASDIIEEYIGTNIINASHTETYDGDGTQYLFLDYYPIVSVSSLSDDDVAISSDDYMIYKLEGYIYYEDGFSNEHQVIDITYSSGYGADKDSIPLDFIHACIKLVCYWFKRDEADYSDTYGESAELVVPASGIPQSVKDILNPYKKRLFR